MLYSPYSASVFLEGDQVTITTVPDTWAPFAPPVCTWCQGGCAGVSGARTPDDFLTWDCRTYPSLPWTINQFCATPTGCQSWPTMVTPYGQRFSPNWCQGTEPPLYCLEHPHLSSWKPTRYSGSMNAAFKLLVTSNAVRPTLCNLTNFNSVNVQKLSTSSNAQMTNSSWDITCKVIGGRAYFVLQIAWTPNIDYTAFGATFVGCDDSGPKQETKSGVPWPAPGWAVAYAGTSSIPNSAVIVRYRMPVSAAAGAHACGVGTGSYEPYEISNPTVFHASSLQALGPATVG
jgi:hypothetical protein